jgi:Leu/Phe-tRNA-protein transferase
MWKCPSSFLCIVIHHARPGDVFYGCKDGVQENRKDEWIEKQFEQLYDTVDFMYVETTFLSLSDF